MTMSKRALLRKVQGRFCLNATPLIHGLCGVVLRRSTKGSKASNNEYLAEIILIFPLCKPWVLIILVLGPFGRCLESLFHGKLPKRNSQVWQREAGRTMPDPKRTFALSGYTSTHNPLAYAPKTHWSVLKRHGLQPWTHNIPNPASPESPTPVAVPW